MWTGEHWTMAWQVWSKLCCGQKWVLLLCPFLLLIISVMTFTLPLPSLPVDTGHRASHIFTSVGNLRSGPQILEPPLTTDSEQLLTYIQNEDGKNSTGKETSTQSLPHIPDGKGNNSMEREQKQVHADLYRNKHKSKEMTGAIQHSARQNHPHRPQFIVNNTGPKRRIRPSNHSAVAKLSGQTCIHPERSKSTPASIPAQTDTLIGDIRTAGRHTGRRRNRRTNRKTTTQVHNSYTAVALAERHQHRQAAKHADKLSKGQQAVEKPSRDPKNHLLKDPCKAKRSPRPMEHWRALPKPEAVLKRKDSSWCQRFTEQDFPDSDHRKLRISPDLQPLPWLSEDDIHKMELLAHGELVSKARVPGHGQVLQVALEPAVHHEQPSLVSQLPQNRHGQSHPDTHDEHCQRGRCALIKRTDDWFEVFAFHLDRVLGLNRSLPAVLRTLHSDILPYRYTRGTPRPVLWWDPDIQHLTDTDNDQNSVSLTWLQYQQMLQAHCGSEAALRSAPCVGVHHSEWGRLALFDFLLQVNDRLDRSCCGFTPDPTDVCVENLLHGKCENPKDLLLVHILVRKADPSTLVFIDNAGRPQQATNNLNFRLVEGIDEFPEKAVSVLESGCLESLLLRSLYTDREFWDSQGGVRGLRPLIHMVEQRGKIFLQHIRDRELMLKRDL